MKLHPTSLLLNIAVALSVAFMVHATPVSTSFTFQGVLKNNNGVPVNGPHDIQVSLYSARNGPALVGNPSQNLFSCSPVNNGLLTLKLNFGGINSYNCEARWLEFAVRPCNSTSFQIITQRVELLPTPYAIQSLSACAVEPNAVTTLGIQDNSVTASKIGPDQVVKSLNGLHDVVNLVAGANVTLTPSGNSLEIAAAGPGGSGIWKLNAPHTYYDAGNVGIGTSDPGATLHVRSARNTLGDNTAVFHNPNVGPNLSHVHYGSTGDWYIRSASGNGKVVLQDSGGNVGIGTASPANKLHVDLNSATFTGLGIDDSYGFLRLGELENSYYLRARSKSSFFPFDYFTHFIVRGDGRVGIGTVNPNAGLAVATGAAGQNGTFININANAANQTGGGIAVSDDGGFFDFNDSFITYKSLCCGGGLKVDANLTVNGSLHLRSARTYVEGFDGANFHWWGEGPGEDNLAFGIAKIGTGNYEFWTSGRIVTPVLTITGGADLAEPFQMSHGDIPNGAVVIIDEDHPGKLKISERAYDNRVAGIVSGANGIKAGITLHQEGLIEGGQNVALSGRVYVQADASDSPIKPGDSLTTSDTPGYAMKVTEHAKAQGAILGKAMTELKEGKGMVLVLVTLQ